MPALNQQEGTFTNINKRIVPTNAALDFTGYNLNDLANVLLEEDIEHTIEYTKKLPINKGFLSIDFDDLKNEFTNDRLENRGYVLNSYDIDISEEIEISSSMELEPKSEEVVIYRANPMNQFNEFTAKAHETSNKSGVFVSASYLKSLEMQDEDRIFINANGLSLETNVYLDKQIEGNIVYVSTFDKNLRTKALFTNSRYNIALIKKA